MADDAGRLNEVLAETSFLYGGNAGFVEDLQARWAADPSAVDPSWRAFFASLSDGATARDAGHGPSWAPKAPAAVDGLWPAVDAKLERAIGDARPAADKDEVRARTLDSPVSYTHLTLPTILLCVDLGGRRIIKK